MDLNLYDIRLCKTSEWNKLKNFINKYWKENHILITSKEIFEFQHTNGHSGYYDFVVAVHKESGEFHAILGFIRSSTYDKTDVNHPQFYFGAVWKVRDDIQNNEVRKLGLAVLFHLFKIFPNSTYITLGLSRDSQNIYKPLHFEFGKLNHYYIGNPNISDFKIAYNPQVNLPNLRNNNLTIKELHKIPDIINKFAPYKNKEYIVGRYVNHPVYKYIFWGIYNKGELKCIWIIRKIEIDSAKCLRIIDMIGSVDGLDNLSSMIIELLHQHNIEYIDCYNHGIDSQIFTKMGFKKVSGDTIIPNYFEPFLKENIDIYYAIYKGKNIVIFKGDADQDRPNIINDK